MPKIKFVGDLPTRKRRVNIDLHKISTQLKARPGEWAIIREYAGQQRNAGYVYAHNCKTGKNRALSPPMGFEVKAQATEHGTVAVYARYGGDLDAG